MENKQKKQLILYETIKKSIEILKRAGASFIFHMNRLERAIFSIQELIYSRQNNGIKALTSGRKEGEEFRRQYSDPKYTEKTNLVSEKYKNGQTLKSNEKTVKEEEYIK